MSRRGQPPVELALVLLAAGYLALAAGLVGIALAIADALAPAPALTEPLIKAKSAWGSSSGASVADFPLCVTVKPPPLRPPAGEKYDYRIGDQDRDKGIV